MTTNRILVIDDDEVFSAVLVRALARRGFEVALAADAKGALAIAEDLVPSRVVLDLNLAGKSGLALITPLLAVNGDCRIVVLTGYASIATAVDAIKLGAVQYLSKPVDIDAILAAFDADNCPSVSEMPATEPLSVGRLEWEHIQRVLRENDGNISLTARALKMHRRTLQRKLAKRPVKA
jgi:two-component system response regulator RegA